MKSKTTPFLTFITLVVCSRGALAQPSSSSSHYWPPSQHARQMEYEAALNATPLRASLRAFHDQYASEPHIAGTQGDARMISRLAMAFRMLSMDVQVHEFWAYLSTPIDAAVEIISPDHLSLPVKEQPLAEDKFSRDAALTIGYNAYSASGDVTAEVVYANQGTKNDFAKLKELGVDCTGKIVLARYGGNFRGYKAKFAQQAGASGLIIYTDPDDAGYRKGVPYPEGGYANESFIQRGSILTLDYPGDPLTPGVAATEDAPRLNPDDVDLPRIPVQPIGYGAAREIMQRMTGRALPPELVKTWQGGLPLAYRLEGGEHLRVRLMVKQERAMTKSANVIGTIWGKDRAAERIIIGCHHDAWGHGAADPLAGLIVLAEVARCFSEAMQNDLMPSRTITFAAWGAEEHGLVGSTEYCEQFAELLSDSAVAYINLDAAAMGLQFGSSASPSLKRLIEEVLRDVPQAQSTSNQSVHQAWLGDRDEASFGNLGGGSDHVGFYCHLGIPSCGLSAGGSHGTSYHSNYDNLNWYRKVVGDDYEPALMLTRIVNLLAARLANAPLLPLDPLRYADDVQVHLNHLQEHAVHHGVAFEIESMSRHLEQFRQSATRVRQVLEERLASETLTRETLDAINELLLKMERDWLRPQSESWYRNMYAMSDPDSGYAARMLPDLRAAVNSKDEQAIDDAVAAYGSVFERLSARVQSIEQLLAHDPDANSGE